MSNIEAFDDGVMIFMTYVSILMPKRAIFHINVFIRPTFIIGNMVLFFLFNSSNLICIRVVDRNLKKYKIPESRYLVESK